MTWKYAHRVRSALAPLAASIAIWAVPLNAARLEWNPNPETNVVGYRVYMGPSSRTYNSVQGAGNTTSFPLDSLTPYQTYFLAVTAYDAEGLESDFSDEVTYTVPGPNRPPVSTGETFFMAKDQALNKSAASGVLANDSDPDLNALTAVLVSTTLNGSLTLDAAGSFLYTPATDFVGQDSFTYQASDGAALSAVTTVTIVVTNSVVVPANRLPVSVNDYYVIGKNGMVFTDDLDGILANDFDLDGDILRPIILAETAHGQLNVAVSGGFTYRPATNYVGTDTFTYCAYDGAATSSVATVTITITNVVPANRPPVATGEQYATGKNTRLLISSGSGVLANDSDPDGNSLTAILVSTPTQGQLTLNASGGFDYMPGTNYVGTDSFGYRASDGIATSAVATVTITITNVVPPNRAPTATAEQYAIGKNQILSVAAVTGLLINDSDPDGNAITAVLASAPAHGNFTISAAGGFTYMPVNDFIGTDTFGYRAFDGAATSSVATVTITITNVVPPNRAPIATAEQYKIGKNQVLSIAAVNGLLANDSDPDGNAITAVLVSAPAHGNFTLNAAGDFTYAPLTDFTGTDSFGYRAFDGVATSAVATVTIVVTNIASLVTNHPPVANEEQYATEKNRGLVVNAFIGVLANDSDPDGNAITATMVSPPVHGQMALETSGAFVYLPATNFVGTDSFTYRTFDGVDVSPVSTVTIIVSNSVSAPNRAPVAFGEQYSIGKDNLMNVSTVRGVLANDSDPDGNAMTPILVTLPAHGSLTMFNTGGFLYMPNAGFVGADNFMYRSSDGLFQSSDATVSIVVSNTATTANGPPVAVGENYTIENGKTLNVDAIHGVLANDSDPDGNPLSVVVVSAPSFGVITMGADGGFSFTADGEFVGTDSFSYRASDGLEVSAIATVVITVTEPVPASEVTCADCLVELNRFVAAHAARVPESAVQVTSSNSLSEVVRAFTRVVKTTRSDDAAATAHLLSVGHCLLNVLSNGVTVRGELVSRMYPSQWSAAAAKLVAALEQTSHGAGTVKDASRSLAAAVKSLKRLDTFITRSQVVPETLEERSIAFALTRSPRFVVTFHGGMFSAQDSEGTILVGTYSFAQTAWDQGTLNLNFVSAPPVTYNLQFRVPRGRVRGPVAKGTFTFVQ